VPAGTDFSVRDVTSGYFIQGKTGRGSNTGKYAVVVRGNNGDTVNISASNGYNTASRIIILDGVMHNVNLLLDTSIPNQPPDITSEPVTTATEDVIYTYQVIASDPNGDNLTYSLTEKPDGMTMSESGFITWTPTNDQVGLNNVKVEVSDGVFTDIQEFTVDVANVNDAPEITSGPITTATQDILYAYDVEAIDIDNDELAYSLTQKPEGMEMNSSGYITWTPNKYQVGMNSVKVEVTDGELADVQEFTIDVANVNDAPQITSTPLTSANEDETYTYQVEASDVDNDPITYSLTEKPEGMEMNESGFITWTPTNDQVGLNNVKVEVSDGTLSNSQIFEINVVNINDAPEITSIPVEVAVSGILYEYQVEAVDIDDEELSYSLNSPPEGMAINGSGFISWDAKHKDSGVYGIAVEVYDGEIVSTQSYNLTLLRIAKVDVFYDGRADMSEVRIMLDMERTEFDVPGNNRDLIINEIVSRTILTRNLVELLIKFHDKGSPGGGGGRIYKKSLQEASLILNQDSDPIIDIFVLSLGNTNLNAKIMTLLTKPPELSQDLKKLVYKYIQIEPGFTEDAVEDYIRMRFRVSKQWLEDNEIPYDSIVLSRYTGKWEDLPTSFVEEKDGFIYYTAVTRGFSYFAITVSDKFVKQATKKAIEQGKASELAKGPGKITGFSVLSPFVVSGIVYDKDGKTQMGGIPFSLKNLNTGELVEGITGEANQPGSFSALITGNLGDDILLTLGEGSQKLEQSLKLNGNTENLRFRLTGTGFVIFKQKGYSNINTLLISLGALLAILIVVIRTRKFQKYKFRIKKALRKNKS